MSCGEPGKTRVDAAEPLSGTTPILAHTYGGIHCDCRSQFGLLNQAFQFHWKGLVKLKHRSPQPDPDWLGAQELLKCRVTFER